MLCVATGETFEVHATKNHPESHYGCAVWVDNNNTPYFDVDLPPFITNPFYKLIEDSGRENNAKID